MDVEGKGPFIESALFFLFFFSLFVAINCLLKVQTINPLYIVLGICQPKALRVDQGYLSEDFTVYFY